MLLNLIRISLSLVFGSLFFSHCFLPFTPYYLAIYPIFYLSSLSSILFYHYVISILFCCYIAYFISSILALRLIQLSICFQISSFNSLCFIRISLEDASLLTASFSDFATPRMFKKLYPGLLIPPNIYHMIY